MKLNLQKIKHLKIKINKLYKKIQNKNISIKTMIMKIKIKNKFEGNKKFLNWGLY